MIARLVQGNRDEGGGWTMDIKNIFSPPADSAKEIIESLLETRSFKLERIISTGQATPRGEWYDQERDEWVVLLSGAAGLLFEGEAEALVLKPGDYIFIPARRKHRVEWTLPGTPTVWLALHVAG
jgi:cupin 2 domain-containing protein